MRAQEREIERQRDKVNVKTRFLHSYFQHPHPYLRLPIMRIIIPILLSMVLLSCQPAVERCRNEAVLVKPYGDSLPVFELSTGMPALERFLDSVLVFQLKDTWNLMGFY